SNGKIDKRALPDPLGLGISTGVVYQGPRNEIESHLIAIYEEVLKRQPIGIHDDFFLLGGDSIKSIQITSRLKQRGYSLRIGDILQHPVIEDLSCYVKQVVRIADQGLFTGMIPLSPIQHFFFEGSEVDRHYFNQSVLLQVSGGLSEEGVRLSLEKLVEHHDALRMVYRSGSEGWEQENLGLEQGYLLEILSVSDDAAFIRECERLESSCDLSKGPLFRAGLFRRAWGDQLLLIAHHLVIDGVSWRILFEDLSALYDQYLRGLPFALPAKTDSFGYWQQQQRLYAQQEVLLSEEAYWSGLSSFAVDPLRKDHPEGSNLVGDVQTLSFSLSAPLTELLLTQCYRAYHTEINDLLVTGLGLALKEVLGQERLLLSMEGHGREEIGSDVDVSRTVGWFTTIYPVGLDLSGTGGITDHLIGVKERLRRVPNKGIGYGILRYLSDKCSAVHPEVRFNYLGDFGTGSPAESGREIFTFSGDAHGESISSKRLRDVSLDVSGILTGGMLHISLSYSDSEYEQETIGSVLSCYQSILEELILTVSSAT
ncbi:condensation domain-containing protein, partial [Pedobacter psychrotolerans]